MSFLLVLFLSLSGCLAALAGPVEDRGGSDCPKAVVVELSSDPLASQSVRAGKYVLSGFLDGHDTYIKGRQAIWFSKQAKIWMIGDTISLGTTKGGLYSSVASDCPTDIAYNFYDKKKRGWFVGGEDVKVRPYVEVEGEQSYTLVDQAGCYSDRYGSYTTLDAAQDACSADKNCQGIYHQTCGTISFQSTLFLCPKDKTYSQSIGPTASCVYQKTDQLFTLNLDNPNANY